MVEKGEVVPSKYYQKPEGFPSGWLESTRRLCARDSSLTFLRSGSAKHAMNVCRKYDYTPMKVNPETLSRRVKSHCNYDAFIRKFHANYCDAEGITRTSDLARSTLVYCKAGMGVLGERPVKVLAILHKKITTGRNRFSVAAKIENRFRAFLHLLRVK